MESIEMTALRKQMDSDYSALNRAYEESKQKREDKHQEILKLKRKLADATEEIHRLVDKLY